MSRESWKVYIKGVFGSFVSFYYIECWFHLGLLNFETIGKS